MKYVVTAINRLSGEREAVTSPKDKETAVRLCVQLKLLKASKRVWLRPRVKPCPLAGGVAAVPPHSRE